MPRRKLPNGRNKDEGQYMLLPYALVQHPNWRRLRPASVKLLIELRSRYNGFNNGRLHISLEEGAKLLGMSKSTVQRAFQQLERHGLITMTKRGHWYSRRATEWAVTFERTEDKLASRLYQKPGFKLELKTERGTEVNLQAGSKGPNENHSTLD